MDQQRYEPFDIDKGADNLFFIGSAFMVLLWFLLWYVDPYVGDVYSTIALGYASSASQHIYLATLHGTDSMKVDPQT